MSFFEKFESLRARFLRNFLTDWLQIFRTVQPHTGPWSDILCLKKKTKQKIFFSFFLNKECHAKGLYEVELSWKFEANPSINGEEILRAVDKRCEFRRKFDVTTKMPFYWFFNDQQLYWPHCSIFLSLFSENIYSTTILIRKKQPFILKIA